MSMFPAIFRNRTTLFRLLLVGALLAISFLATTRLSIPVAEKVNDKVGHAAAFFLLALLFDLSFPVLTFRTKVLMLITYGLSIEIIQSYLPYRSCSLYDLGADAAGLALYGICQPALRYFPLTRRELAADNKEGP